VTGATSWRPLHGLKPVSDRPADSFADDGDSFQHGFGLQIALRNEILFAGERLNSMKSRFPL
jgi:hypothetical protein